MYCGQRECMLVGQILYLGLWCVLPFQQVACCKHGAWEYTKNQACCSVCASLFHAPWFCSLAGQHRPCMLRMHTPHPVSRTTPFGGGYISMNIVGHRAFQHRVYSPLNEKANKLGYLQKQTVCHMYEGLIYVRLC